LRELGGLVPGPQRGRGIERRAAGVPARSAPEFEVQVARGGVAGLADPADLIARADLRALLVHRRVAQVHVDVVDAGTRAVDDEVVARAALEARELHRAAARRDEGEAAVGHDVLALMHVAGAGGAEAVAV